MMFRPLPIMTLATLASLFVLFVLGHWQWQKYIEKSALQDTVIEWQDLNAKALDIQPLYLNTVLMGRPAWLEIGVFEQNAAAAEAPAYSYTLAVMGVDFSIEPPTSPLSQAEEFIYQRAVGRYRTPAAPGLFTPPADLQARHFFALDFPALDELTGVPLEQTLFEPQRFMARDETGMRMMDNPNAYPGGADDLPPQRHFGYALTWWGLLLGLIFIYVTYHISQGRLTFRRVT